MYTKEHCIMYVHQFSKLSLTLQKTFWRVRDSLLQ